MLVESIVVILLIIALVLAGIGIHYKYGTDHNSAEEKKKLNETSNKLFVASGVIGVAASLIGRLFI